MRARYSHQKGYVIASRRTNRPTVRTVKRSLKFGPTTAKYFGLAILAVLAVIMLTRSSENSASAYTKLQLNKDIGTTEREVREAQLAAQRVKSLEETQKDTALTGQMQPMQNADYSLEKGEVAGASTQAP
jgi:hypothetical protein